MALRGPVAVTVAVVTAFVLGYWGYHSLPGHDYSVSDDLYRSLQLFNASGELPPTGTPWQLDVARWLAPLALAYAALAAFFAIARQEVQRARTRLFAREHVVIVGLGSRGSALATSLREAYHVVGIELDSANGAASTLRHEGVPVIVGDARDEAVLLAARAERASHVVVLCGTDTRNLQVAATLKRLTAGTPGVHHVTIDSPVLWNELSRIPLTAEADGQTEFVSIPDRIAVALIGAAMDGWSGGGDDGVQVLVRGEGPAAARLIVHLLRTETLGGSPEILLASSDHEEVRALIRRADPWALERAHLVDLRAGDEVEAEVPRADVAFVCGVAEASALSEAIELVRGMREDARLYLAVEDPDVADGLIGAGIDTTRLVPVPAADWVLTERLLRRRSVELIARARQNAAVLDDIAKGADHDHAWEQLTRPERELQRVFAEAIVDELGRIRRGGADIVPLTGPPEEAGAVNLSDEEVELISRRAQDRRADAAVAAGTEATAGSLETKRWDELLEPDREGIREEVRTLPQTLARAGFELRVPGTGATGSDPVQAPGES